MEEKNKTFEEKMSELEKIVISMENGNLSLDELIKNFEKGMNTAKECNDFLESAEKKITILLNKNNNIEEDIFES